MEHAFVYNLMICVRSEKLVGMAKLLLELLRESDIHARRRAHDFVIT